MIEEKIHFIMTGGTIDSRYDGAKDTVVPLTKSVIPEYFRSIGFTDTDTTFTQICMKDSRELTAEDLEGVLRTIEQSEQKRVIVTHGTYTMPDTARYLKDNLKRNDQVVILTGSVIPLPGFTPSDAPFNLGYAVSQLNHLSPGVYVCMHGKTFNADEVKKDIHLGRFYSMLGEK